MVQAETKDCSCDTRWIAGTAETASLVACSKDMNFWIHCSITGTTTMMIIWWHTESVPTPHQQYHMTTRREQESRAIAKMTARCALYMDAQKKNRNSLAMPTATFPEIVNGLLL